MPDAAAQQAHGGGSLTEHSDSSGRQWSTSRAGVCVPTDRHPAPLLGTGELQARQHGAGRDTPAGCSV